MVIFRTDAGSKLDAAVRGDRLAFEIDGFDALEQTGWSVLVRGAAELVTDEAELGLLRSMPLVSWAPGLKPIYVRLGVGRGHRPANHGPGPARALVGLTRTCR